MWRRGLASDAGVEKTLNFNLLGHGGADHLLEGFSTLRNLLKVEAGSRLRLRKSIKLMWKVACLKLDELRQNFLIVDPEILQAILETLNRVRAFDNLARTLDVSECQHRHGIVL